MQITFIIVNYLSSSYLKDLVLSLRAYIKSYSYEILVCDNSNTPSEKVNLESFAGLFDKLIFEPNIGFVKGNNKLFEMAKGELLVLINPDVLLKNPSLEYIFSSMLDDKNIGIAGPKLLNEDLSYQVSFTRFPKMWTTIQEHILFVKNDPYGAGLDAAKEQNCDVIKGACLVLRKSALEGADVFDEDFIMYSEETDLCWRVRKSGYKVKYYPQSEVIHFGGKSSSDSNAVFYITFNYFRSKLLFFYKHFSAPYSICIRIVLFISLLMKSMGMFLTGNSKKALIFYKVFKAFFLLPYRNLKK